MEAGYTLFETSLGLCGIAWSASSLRGLQLPEPDEAKALIRLHSRFPDLGHCAPPSWVSANIDQVTGFLAGAIETDLAAIPLDLESVGQWERRVYLAARQIKVGTTVTYGWLATKLGDRALARAVGQSLGNNPWPIVIPCHRITAVGGGVGGFSAPGGRETKLRLLEIEGALAAEALPLFAPRPT